MKIAVNGHKVHFSTGGREHVAGRPTILFLHGAGQSRLSWALQVRVFAYDGWNVIAPDLPGHGLSEGEPLATIEEQAQWVQKLLVALGIESVHLVGHSQGGLIAMELFDLAPQRIASICFVATAATIGVNQTLIDLSINAPHKANALLVSWGSGPHAHAHDNTLPGVSLIYAGLRIMEQNPPEALTADFKACAAYGDGEMKAARISCPTLGVFAGLDRLTPLKSGLKLAGLLPDNVLHVIDDCGHMLPLERPRQLNGFLRDFYRRQQMAAA